MKERPIIFTHNIPKILDGTKTQTRRVLKPQPFFRENKWWCWLPGKNVEIQWHQIYDMKMLTDYCPYGQVGDRLWVRETFWIQHDSEWNEYSANLIDHGINIAEDDWAEVRYCATDIEPNESECPLSIYSKRPSIHMPRWASRITLEITGIRVERLQEITVEGCIAEGYPLGEIVDSLNLKQLEIAIAMRIGWYRTLWNSLNAKRGYSWESNPWVWVIEFKKL